MLPYRKIFAIFCETFVSSHPTPKQVITKSFCFSLQSVDLIFLNSITPTLNLLLTCWTISTQSGFWKYSLKLSTNHFCMDYTCTRKPKRTENQTQPMKDKSLTTANSYNILSLTVLPCWLHNSKIETKNIRTKLQVLHPSLIFRYKTERHHESTSCFKVCSTEAFLIQTRRNRNENKVTGCIFTLIACQHKDV